MLHAVIIGGGYIGDCHVSAYKALPSGLVSLEAVVDANPVAGEALAAKAGCAYYSTLEEVLAQHQIDVVDICLPTFLHDTFAIKAASYGKHVLCEKPVTLSLEQFDAMDAACKKNGVRFMVAQVARFVPEFAEVARRVRSGELGRLHMVTEKRLSQPPAWTRWHADPNKSGGGLFDLNVHDIDFLYSLFGLPESVYAMGWKSPTGCWNHVATSLRWADGTQAICETSLEMTGSFPFSVELRLTGDNGTIAFDSKAGANIKDAAAVNGLVSYPVGKEPEKLEVDAYDPFAKEIEGFLRAIEEGTQVPVPPEESRDVLRIVLATRESMENGTVVRL